MCTTNAFTCYEKYDQKYSALYIAQELHAFYFDHLELRYKLFPFLQYFYYILQLTY